MLVVVEVYVVVIVQVAVVAAAADLVTELTGLDSGSSGICCWQ